MQFTKNKKILALLSMWVMLSSSAMPQESYYETTNNNGGTICFDFNNESQKNQFSFYSEHGKKPWLQDGHLVAWTMCEQKISLNDYIFDDFIAEVNVGTLNYNGKFDAGLYVHASNFSNRIDGVNAYCVNIEGGGKSTYIVKLHQFYNNSWLGEKARSAIIPFVDVNNVNLKVIVEDGYLSVYTDNYQTAHFKYYIGSGKGNIGFRSFYSPNTFDDLKITAECFEKDITKLDALLTECRNIKENDYTPLTFAKFYEFLSTLNDLVYDDLNQIEIDNYYKKLQSEKNKLLKRHTKEELQNLVREKEKLTNKQELYTQNSWNSLQICIENSKIAIEGNDVEEISYWYEMLLRRFNALIMYQ